MIRYQIMDASGGLDYLGLVKANVNRLIQTGLDDFTRTWDYGGVSIRVRCFIVDNDGFELNAVSGDYIAKIWLTGGSGRFFYDVGLQNPCVCRTVFILKAGVSPVISFAGSSTLENTGDGQLLTETNIINISVQGAIIESYTGTFQQFNNTVVGELVNSWQATTKNPSYSNGTGFQQTYKAGPGINTAAAFQAVIDANPPTPIPGFGVAAQAAADAAGGHVKWRVLLSDGTELASWDISLDSHGVDQGAPLTTIWSGDGYVDLTDGTRMTFVVPPDVCRPAKPDTYPVNSVNGNLLTSNNGINTYQTVFSGAGGSFTRFGSSNASDLTNQIFTDVPSTLPYPLSIGDGENSIATPGSTPVAIAALFTGVLSQSHFGTGVSGTFTPIANLPEYSQAFGSGNAKVAIDWNAARAVATVRERTRLKACSDNFITNLLVGATDSVQRSARSNRVYSTHTNMPTLMTVDVVTGQFGSGDDITFTRVVTLTSTTPAPNPKDDPIINTSTINGSKHVVITHCTDSLGHANAAQFTTTTYSAWLPINSLGSTGSAIDDVFIEDIGQGLCQQWDGAVISGANTYATTFDSSGGVYTPPLPVSSDNRTYSYPVIYRQYRAAIKRVYDKNQQGAQRSWLDSAFADKEIIDVFPLMTIHAKLGNLGLFPQSDDIQDSTQLSMQVSNMFSYKYAYNTGLWSFVVAKQTIDAKQNPAPINITYSSIANSVFKSDRSEWPDVLVIYNTQQKRLAVNPITPPDPPLSAAELLYQQIAAVYPHLQKIPPTK